MKRTSRPTRVGELLGASLPKEPSGRGSLVAIVRAWPSAVGEEVARRAWPARMAGSALIVHAESSVWVAELQLMADTALERLRTAVGPLAPAEIRFRVGPVPDRPAPRHARPPSAVPDAARRRARELAAPIHDDALRAAAEQAIAGAIVRTESA